MPPDSRDQRPAKPRWGDCFNLRLFVFAAVVDVPWAPPSWLWRCCRADVGQPPASGGPATWLSSREKSAFGAQSRNRRLLHLPRSWLSFTQLLQTGASKRSGSTSWLRGRCTDRGGGGEAGGAEPGRSKGLLLSAPSGGLSAVAVKSVPDDPRAHPGTEPWGGGGGPPSLHRPGILPGRMTHSGFWSGARRKDN